ncbi:olfactory receptor 6B1-like [Hyperolius riggenbachi]|uniref:olfactory receptor 6B1-like n=1 Tax=Hyperolius riggenbachi TaxID=752182 RepID=UPI0035A3C4B0
MACLKAESHTGPALLAALNKQVDFWLTPHQLEIGKVINLVATQQFNQTGVTNFLLLGFSLVEQARLFLFIVLSTVYIFTIAANVFIIVLIKAEPRLHKPMYFFIGGLSFLELWFPSVTVPRLIWSLKTKDHYISLAGCMAQFYFHFSLGATEMLLLTAMAYDRYVAICNPLRYLTIMSPYICAGLILGSWSCGFILYILPWLRIFTLWYCDRNQVDHYYCDFAPVVRLSCSDTAKAEITFFYTTFFITVGCLLLILTSYACITQTIIKCPTASGRRKAFSTFASHLSVVTLFYGTIMFMFIRPAKVVSLHFNKIVSIFPSVVTPLLNPIIYTLRNQEVMEAVLRATHRVIGFQEKA